MIAEREVSGRASGPIWPAARRRLARLVTEVLAPSPLCAALLVAVAAKSAPSVGDALRWGLLAAAFASVFPFLYICAACVSAG